MWKGSLSQMNSFCSAMNNWASSNIILIARSLFKWNHSWQLQHEVFCNSNKHFVYYRNCCQCCRDKRYNYRIKYFISRLTYENGWKSTTSYIIVHHRTCFHFFLLAELLVRTRSNQTSSCFTDNNLAMLLVASYWQSSSTMKITQKWIIFLQGFTGLWQLYSLADLKLVYYSHAKRVLVWVRDYLKKKHNPIWI